MERKWGGRGWPPPEILTLAVFSASSQLVPSFYISTCISDLKTARWTCRDIEETGVDMHIYADVFHYVPLTPYSDVSHTLFNGAYC